MAARTFVELSNDLRAKDIEGKYPLNYALSGNILVPCHTTDDGDAAVTISVASLKSEMKLKYLTEYQF